VPTIAKKQCAINQAQRRNTFKVGRIHPLPTQNSLQDILLISSLFSTFEWRQTCLGRSHEEMGALRAPKMMHEVHPVLSKNAAEEFPDFSPFPHEHRRHTPASRWGGGVAEVGFPW
jgi:hypothetical protein